MLYRLTAITSHDAYFSRYYKNKNFYSSIGNPYTTIPTMENAYIYVFNNYKYLCIFIIFTLMIRLFTIER